MQSARNSWIVLIAALSALTIGTLACDKKSDPVKPGPPLASLETIWPNADGRGWKYALHRAEWTDTSTAGYFDTVIAVPPIPPLSTLRSIVAGLQNGPSPSADSASMELRFDGLRTTGPGVTAQNLVETLSAPVTASLHSGSADPFLAELLRARPDLRGALSRRLRSRTLGSSASGVLFLHGNIAWLKTAKQIITYGDVDTLPAWKYLDSNIVPGAEFTQQLVPSLADNIYLHGRIVGKKSVVTPAGTYANAIECDYSVDYGIGAQADNKGNLVGYYRSVTYGTVAYVDSLGPVAETARHLMRVVSATKLTDGVGVEQAGLTELVLPLPRPGFGLVSRWRR